MSIQQHRSFPSCCAWEVAYSSKGLGQTAEVAPICIMKPESAWYCRQVKGLQRSPSPVRPQPVLPLARQESRPDSPPSPAAMPDRSRPSGADPHSHREQEVWGGQTAGWRQEVAAGRAPNVQAPLPPQGSPYLSQIWAVRHRILG